MRNTTEWNQNRTKATNEHVRLNRKQAPPVATPYPVYPLTTPHTTLTAREPETRGQNECECERATTRRAAFACAVSLAPARNESPAGWHTPFCASEQAIAKGMRPRSHAHTRVSDFFCSPGIQRKEASGREGEREVRASLSEWVVVGRGGDCVICRLCKCIHMYILYIYVCVCMYMCICIFTCICNVTSTYVCVCVCALICKAD